MRILVIIFMVLHSSFINGQIRLNIGGGLNLSNVKYEQVPSVIKWETKPVANYFISVRPEIALSDKFSAHMDLQYSRKGYATDVPSNDNSETRFHYLDVLPQIQYKVLNFLGIYAGAGMTYMRREDTRFEGKWIKFPFEINNSTSFAYLAGFRIYPSKKISFNTHLSTNRIDHIEFTDDKGNPIDLKSRLYNLQIGVTYRIL